MKEILLSPIAIFAYASVLFGLGLFIPEGTSEQTPAQPTDLMTDQEKCQMVLNEASEDDSYCDEEGNVQEMLTHEQLREAKSASNRQCDIKGNISYGTGEKIYHVPGQAFYEQTIIDTPYGEKMFCSEQEAINAGWRKAYE